MPYIPVPAAAGATSCQFHRHADRMDMHDCPLLRTDIFYGELLRSGTLADSVTGFTYDTRASPPIFPGDPIDSAPIVIPLPPPPTEPAPTEPVPTEPTPTEPIPIEPIPIEPDITPVDPVPVELPPVEPPPGEAHRFVRLDIVMDADRIRRDEVTIHSGSTPPTPALFAGLIDEDVPQLKYKGAWALSDPTSALRVDTSVQMTLMCLCDNNAIPYHGTGRLIIDHSFGEGSLTFLTQASDGTGQALAHPAGSGAAADAKGIIYFALQGYDGLISDDAAWLEISITANGQILHQERQVHMLSTMPDDKGSSSRSLRGMFYSNGDEESGAFLGHFGADCYQSQTGYVESVPCEN